MKIDVLSLARTPGETLPLKFDVSIPELKLSEDMDESFAKVGFEGELLSVENGVFQLSGKLSVLRIGVCDRCLAPAEQKYEVVIDEQYRRSAGSAEIDESGEYYCYVGHQINTDQAIRDNLLLNMPGQLLCRESCPGFCPVCGRDLNEGSCSCQNETASGSPFAKLSKLLQDDK